MEEGRGRRRPRSPRPTWLPEEVRVVVTSRATACARVACVTHSPPLTQPNLLNFRVGRRHHSWAAAEGSERKPKNGARRERVLLICDGRSHLNVRQEDVLLNMTNSENEKLLQISFVCFYRSIMQSGIAPVTKPSSHKGVRAPVRDSAMEP